MSQPGTGNGGFIVPDDGEALVDPFESDERLPDNPLARLFVFTPDTLIFFVDTTLPERGE